MKKTILICLTFFAVSVFAQEKPIISTAIIAMNKNDLVEAKEQIDKAGEIIDQKGAAGVDEKQMSKYLYHKALIYYRMSVNSDSAIQAMVPNGLDVAMEYYTKTLEYEQKSGKDRYTTETMGQLPYVVNGMTNRAFNKNAAQDYAGAAKDFLTVYNARKNPALGENAVVDTTSYYYAGVSSLYAGEYAKAAQIMTEVLDMGYDGYTFVATSLANDQEVRFATEAQMKKQEELGTIKDGKRSESMRIEVYKTLLNAYQKAEDSENFKAALLKARAEFPNDGDLVKQELQVYLDTKEYDKALAVLEEAIEKEPNNAILYYVKGYIYQNEEAIKDDAKALAAYGKALEIDPKNFECLYNTGAIYYAEGKGLVDEMNQLGMSPAEQKKYNQLQKEKNVKFEQSLPYFEKAYEVNPKDVANVEALWQVHRQLKNGEEMMKYKEILDELKTAAAQ